MNLGLAVSEQGDYGRAFELYRESLELAHTGGEDDQVALTLANLARTHISQGALEQAEAQYAEAAPIFQRLGNRAGLGYVSYGRGIVALKLGNRSRALDLIIQALSAFHESGVRLYAILCIVWLASVAEQHHDPGRAVRLLGASESLRVNLGVARPLIDQAEYDACLTTVRNQLGKDAFAAAWAEAGTMNYEQTVAYAMNTATCVGWNDRSTNLGPIDNQQQ